MLWIGLAVGTVIGLVVFLVIKLSTWVGDRLPAPRNEPTNALAAPRFSPDDVASYSRRRDAAILVVDGIKQQLGELRTDVEWTISNSALWDVAVPASKRFFTSLTIWDDHRAGWTVEETVAAAAELKVLWRAALDSATRLGIDHLAAEDRHRADTAIKLVRKADSTTSEAERHQLMAKAAEVLSGIMSITLPRETMRELERGSTPQELSDDPDDVEPPEN